MSTPTFHPHTLAALPLLSSLLRAHLHHSLPVLRTLAFHDLHSRPLQILASFSSDHPPLTDHVGGQRPWAIIVSVPEPSDGQLRVVCSLESLGVDEISEEKLEEGGNLVKAGVDTMQELLGKQSIRVGCVNLLWPRALGATGNGSFCWVWAEPPAGSKTPQEQQAVEEKEDVLLRPGHDSDFGLLRQDLALFSQVY